MAFDRKDWSQLTSFSVLSESSSFHSHLVQTIVFQFEVMVLLVKVAWDFGIRQSIGVDKVVLEKPKHLDQVEMTRN